MVEDAKRLVFDVIFEMLAGRGVCDAVAAFGKIGAESHLVVVLLGVHNEWSNLKIECVCKRRGVVRREEPYVGRERTRRPSRGGWWRIRSTRKCPMSVPILRTHAQSPT